MPSLKDLTCAVKWTDSDEPLKEYDTAYSDGQVDCYLALPNDAGGFFVEVRSGGYIAPGLAAFVYIDGVFQCNRNRQNFELPGEDAPAHRSKAKFVLRQKEAFRPDGTMWGSSWTFHKLTGNTETRATEPPQYNGEQVGTIEVVVRRCVPGVKEMNPATMFCMPKGYEQSARTVASVLLEQYKWIGGYDGAADERDDAHRGQRQYAIGGQFDGGDDEWAAAGKDGSWQDSFQKLQGNDTGNVAGGSQWGAKMTGAKTGTYEPMKPPAEGNGTASHDNKGQNTQFSTPDWGDKSASAEKRNSTATAVSTTTKPAEAAPVSATQTFAHSAHCIHNPPQSADKAARPLIDITPKSYWTEWNKVESKAGYKPPKNLLRHVPQEAVTENLISHQTANTKATAYMHRLGRPKYIDSMEKPYAVFCFRYRSIETVEKILGIDLSSPPDSPDPETLSKEELVAKVNEYKKMMDDMKSSTPTRSPAIGTADNPIKLESPEANHDGFANLENTTTDNWGAAAPGATAEQDTAQAWGGGTNDNFQEANNDSDNMPGGWNDDTGNTATGQNNHDNNAGDDAWGSGNQNQISNTAWGDTAQNDNQDWSQGNNAQNETQNWNQGNNDTSGVNQASEADAWKNSFHALKQDWSQGNNAQNETQNWNQGNNDTSGGNQTTQDGAWQNTFHARNEAELGPAQNTAASGWGNDNANNSGWGAVGGDSNQQNTGNAGWTNNNKSPQQQNNANDGWSGGNQNSSGGNNPQQQWDSNQPSGNSQQNQANEKPSADWPNNSQLQTMPYYGRAADQNTGNQNWGGGQNNYASDNPHGGNTWGGGQLTSAGANGPNGPQQQMSPNNQNNQNNQNATGWAVGSFGNDGAKSRHHQAPISANGNSNNHAQQQHNGHQQQTTPQHAGPPQQTTPHYNGPPPAARIPRQRPSLSINIPHCPMAMQAERGSGGHPHSKPHSGVHFTPQPGDHPHTLDDAWKQTFVSTYAELSKDPADVLARAMAGSQARQAARQAQQGGPGTGGMPTGPTTWPTTGPTSAGMRGPMSGHVRAQSHFPGTYIRDSVVNLGGWPASGPAVTPETGNGHGHAFSAPGLTPGHGPGLASTAMGGIWGSQVGGMPNSGYFAGQNGPPGAWNGDGNVAGVSPMSGHRRGMSMPRVPSNWSDAMFSSLSSDGDAGTRHYGNPQAQGGGQQGQNGQGGNGNGNGHGSGGGSGPPGIGGAPAAASGVNNKNGAGGATAGDGAGVGAGFAQAGGSGIPG